MPRLSFSLALALLLVGCTDPNRTGAPIINGPRGQSVGNGGDPLTSLFEQGRLHATQVLRRLRFPAGATGDVRWLSENAERLAADVQGSPHDWTTPTHVTCPPASCGCTLPLQATSPVYFSLESCGRNVRTRADASRILVHESVHHLVGADEATADRLAALVAQLWVQQGHPDEPHWMTVNAPVSGSAYSIGQAGANGEFYLLFETGAYRWLPKEAKWAFTEAENAREFWRLRMAALNEDSVGVFLVGDKLVVINPVWGPTTLEPVLVFDLKTRRWESGATGGATAMRAWAHMENADGLLWVWGGMSFSGVSRTDGAIYDVAQNTWSPIADFPGPVPALPGVAWNGRRAIVWGGSRWNAKENNWVLPREAYVYQRAENRWQSVPEEFAPGGRVSPAAVATSNEAIFYGGYFDTSRGTGLRGADTFERSGGILNLKTLRWTAMDTQAAPVPLLRQGGPEPLPVWTGTRWLMLGETFGSYDPQFNRWESRAGLVHPQLSDRPRGVWTGVEMLTWQLHSEKLFAFYP